MTNTELRATRKRLGLTQAQLAAALGISVSQLHNYERGSDRRTGAPCPVPRLVELAIGMIAFRVGFSRPVNKQPN
jgi:transcriptional regulator with XRE-family HTH domain